MIKARLFTGKLKGLVSPDYIDLDLVPLDDWIALNEYLQLTIVNFQVVIHYPIDWDKLQIDRIRG